MASSKGKEGLYSDPDLAKFLPVHEWVDDNGVYCEDWHIHEYGLQGELLTVMDGPKRMLSSSAEELYGAFGALCAYHEGEPYRWIAEHGMGYPLESVYRQLRRFSNRWLWERFTLDVPPFVLYQYPGTTRRPLAVWLLTHLLEILEDKAEAEREADVPPAIIDALVLLDVKAMIAQNKAGLGGLTPQERNTLWLQRADYRKAYDQAWNASRDIAYPPPRF